MNGLVIKDLYKSYGSTCALAGADLSFEKGKIYGLLGRNGAGKTTLLNIITGRVFADKGSVCLDGQPTPENDAALRQMYMLSEQTFYPDSMRVREALKWSAAFYPGFDAEYAQSLAERFLLDVNARVRGLSTGYNTIFKIVAALSVNVPYLLLDEPVLGLDANHRDLFYKLLLEKHGGSGCCVVLSTHLVEEVSPLVEDVVIIHKGRIVKNEPRETLLANGYTVSGPAAAVEAFIDGKTVLGQNRLGGLSTAYVAGIRPAEAPAGLELAPMDLQRAFIQLTND